MALGSLMKDTTGNTSHRVPMQPAGLNAWNVKHNAKDGTMSIVLPNSDENDEERPRVVEGIESVTFVPVLSYRNIHGSIDDDTVGSNPTFEARHFDTYVYHDGSVESLGVFGNKEIKEQPFGVGYRLFGFVTTVDGVNVNKHEKLKEYVPTDGLVFCFMQFTPYKLYQLCRQLRLDYSTVSTSIAGKLLTVESKTKLSEDAQTYRMVNGKHTSWAPKFMLNKLADTVNQRLEKKMDENYTEPLTAYSKQIENRDQYLKTLVMHGINGSMTVNRLEDAGLYDVTTINKFLEEGNTWKDIFVIAYGSSSLSDSPEEPSPDDSGKGNADVMDIISGNASNESTFDEDDLPF